jgi:uncharacterized membrane protein
MVKLKLEKGSVPILYLVLIIPLVIALLGSFGWINLTSFTASILLLLTSLFVMTEVGFMGMVKRKKVTKDFINLGGAVVALLMVITTVWSLVTGSPLNLLAPIQGVLGILVVAYVFITAFR